MGFEENDVGVDYEKETIHAERWYVYMNNKTELIKGGYSAEVSGFDWKKVIWEVVEDHVVEEEKKNDEIGLRGI